jgi:hypothetical protein
MKKITSAIELKETILLLEIKQMHQAVLLKQEFKNTYESLKPVNIIKHKFNELLTSAESQENLLDTVIGVAAGYLSKKIIVGATHNPIKQLLGMLLQMGVTNIVSKNADGVKSTFGNLLTAILSKKNKAA